MGALHTYRARGSWGSQRVLPLTDLHRPTGASRAHLASSGTFGPSLSCLFLCPGHLEESDNGSLCPAAGSAQPAPQTTPSPHSSSCESHCNPPPRWWIEALGARWACTCLQSTGGLILMELHHILCYSEHPSLHAMAAHVWPKVRPVPF